jgi:hypothetical protein
MDNKRKDDDYDNNYSGVDDGQEDDWSDDDLSDTEENDPEDEEFDDPNDSQTQAEKTKYDIDAMEYLSTLQLATQKSVRELKASKKCKSLEVTIPLSLLIIVYSRRARRFPLHFHEDSVHCLSVISNIVRSVNTHPSFGSLKFKI